MEPPVAAGGLATEAQDKVPEGVLLEGQSHVHEDNMLKASLVSILDGVPDGEDVWMYDGKCLATIGCIPEVGLSLTVYHSRAADDVSAKSGHEEASVFVLMQTSEKFV